MRKLSCKVCGHQWTTSYLKWLFTTLFHRFSFKDMKDYRLTKCPYCGHKDYITSFKTK